MIALIILVVVLLAFSAILFWRNSYGRKDYEVNFFYEAILIILVFAFASIAMRLSEEAKGKCPELTPVKEQLYKVK